MRLASVILASCLFLGGCCLNSVKDQQLILTVPPTLLEAPAEPKTLRKSETPQIAPRSFFG